MSGIPDPGGASGTFAALERTSQIVVAGADGVPTTTSMRVANGTRVQHKNVLEMVRGNLADFEEFGRVAFQTRPFDTAGGVQAATVAILNEEHATLLLTYMRNNDVVRDFKKRLVREFAALRRGEVRTLTPLEYARKLVDAEERAEAAESKVRELAVPASAWNELAEAAGDYSVADAAKVLSRDDSISIGRDRLFDFMARLHWIYRPRGGRWRAYQDQVDNGRLTEKVGKPFVRDGEMHNGEPTVRIRPKGLAELHRRLGGTGQQMALAVAP